MLVDVHFHTYVYTQEELAKALIDIQENRVFLCSVTCEIHDWTQTLEIVKQSNQILPMFGIHPGNALNHVENLQALNPYMKDASMFGEIGLDRIWVKDSSQWPAQDTLLAYFLESAEKEDKPVMLHTNGGEREVLDMLDTHSISRAIFHDYDCSLAVLKEIVDRDYYLTIGRTILDEYKARVPNWDHFLEMARVVPEDLLLTESDGPPRDHRMPYDVLMETISRVANSYKNLRQTWTSLR
ncbi:MAG: TatD family hydrolase [Candidatus Thorarchaeota archaeon]|nr:TatD family hydrolase [Candidatus Thorarchaeota archaeon]